MSSWFAYGVPIAALAVGLVGLAVIQLQSRAFDRRHPEPSPLPADARPPAPPS